MFRQQAASKINSTLYAVTFLAQQGGKVRSCSYCPESDHGEEECSLAPKPQSTGGKRENTQTYRDQTAAAPHRQRQVCFAWNEGRLPVPVLSFPACVCALSRRPQTYAVSSAVGAVAVAVAPWWWQLEGVELSSSCTCMFGESDIVGEHACLSSPICICNRLLYIMSRCFFMPLCRNG